MSIASRLQVSTAAVYWHSRDWPKRAPVMPPTLDWVRGKALWDAGESAAAIAAALGTTTKTVVNARYTQGWHPRTCTTRPEWVEARAMWDRGRHIGEIAAFMGVSVNRIYSFASRQNWPGRKAVRPETIRRAPRLQLQRGPRAPATPSEPRCTRCGGRLNADRVCRGCVEGLLSAIPAHPGLQRSA